MKCASTVIDPFATVEAPAGFIGIVIQTERVEQHTMGGLTYGAPHVICYAVFHGAPLDGMTRKDLPSHLCPTRGLAILRPGDKMRVNVRYPLGSIGVFTFKRKGDVLYVQPTGRSWRKKLIVHSTGRCDIPSII